MTEPRVVVRKEERKTKPVRPWGDGATFRVVGWLGLVFVVATLADFALAVYPFGLGSPEWEVGTVGAIVQGFPLFALGMVGIWLCGGGLGNRGVLVAVGVAFWLGAVALLVMLALLLTDFPIALRGTEGSDAARLGILKLMVKTVFLGLLFGGLYGVAGTLAIRQARGGPSN